MRCAVCSHPKRASIEGFVEHGSTLADVAARYELSELALERHLAHAPPVPKKKASPPRASAARVRAPHTRTPRARTRAPLPPETDVDEEPPATSRSPQLVTARAKLDQLLTRIDRLLAEIEADEDASLDTRIAAIRAVVTPIKLLGQFTGELGVSEATVASSTHFKRLLSAILEALRPREFSAAREAVIAALEAEQRGRTAEAAA